MINLINATMLAATLLFGGCAANTTCIPGKDFKILNEVNLKNNAKVAIVKDIHLNYKIMEFANNQCRVIKTKNPVDKHYELDSVRTTGGITIVELFLRMAGDNTATGFLYSSDYNRNFRYIDVSDISSDIGEGIQSIKIGAENNAIYVSLYDVHPNGHFVSTDSCRSWQLRP